jgi:hypothetical protein
MATDTRARKKKEPTSQGSERVGDRRRTPRKWEPQDAASTRRDERLFGAERFPRKGDDKESS